MLDWSVNTTKKEIEPRMVLCIVCCMLTLSCLGLSGSACNKAGSKLTVFVLVIAIY